MPQTTSMTMNARKHPGRSVAITHPLDPLTLLEASVVAPHPEHSEGQQREPVHYSSFFMIAALSIVPMI